MAYNANVFSPVFAFTAFLELPDFLFRSALYANLFQIIYVDHNFLLSTKQDKAQ